MGQKLFDREPDATSSSIGADYRLMDSYRAMPETAAPSAGAAESVASEKPEGAGARILVVDDDQAVREFAVDVLTSIGYVVASANGGIPAMRFIEEIPSLDLLFTDIVMPGLNGIVLADMVKQRRPELKILYATGYRDIARAESDAGIIHGKILEKPYRLAELESEVHHLLS